MKKPVTNFGAIAVATCVLFGVNVMAQTVSASDFSAGKTRIKAQYKADKNACATLASNAKDICVAQAKGKEDVALAELDNSYKPTLKSQHKLSVAKAEAIYEVAKQQCDDLAGNLKDVCIKEAKAALTAAKADATAKMKTSAANTTASDKTAAAQARASSEVRRSALMLPPTSVLRYTRLKKKNVMPLHPLPRTTA